jgi:hypothetical protein
MSFEDTTRRHRSGRRWDREGQEQEVAQAARGGSRVPRRRWGAGDGLTQMELARDGFRESEMEAVQRTFAESEEPVRLDRTSLSLEQVEGQPVRRRMSLLDAMWRGWMDEVAETETHAERAELQEEAWMAMGDRSFRDLLFAARIEGLRRRSVRFAYSRRARPLAGYTAREFSGVAARDLRFEGAEECNLAQACLGMWRHVRMNPQAGSRGGLVTRRHEHAGRMDWGRTAHERRYVACEETLDGRFATEGRDDAGTPTIDGAVWGFPCPWEGIQRARWYVLRRPLTRSSRLSGHRPPLYPPDPHRLLWYVESLELLGREAGELEDDRLRRACLSRLMDAPTSRGGREPGDMSHMDPRGRAVTPVL